MTRFDRDAPANMGAAGVLDPRDPGWERFVATHPDALPFHEPAWAEMLAECYGFRPFVLTISDPGGEIQGGIPIMELRDPLRGRRWTALPFTDRCPPLLASAESDEPLAAVLRSAAADAGIARLQVRSPLSGFESTTVATTHELDLSPGPDALEGGFSSAARRGTRKARREGVVVHRARFEEELTSVYYGLHLQTRRRLGVPVQPRRFFRQLWRQMLEPGLGHLLLATANDVPIAGAVFLHAGRTVVYKFGASDARAWGLRPNNLLFTHAIRWSADAGYAKFDFGRSGFADHGLRSFKTGWGAVERRLVYSALRDGHAGVGDNAPRLLGEVIRHSPAAVCRAIGETLYRYAA
jgi:CelD/BcsL family acetyltransferase involved in cellulose biosynthesis